MEYRPRYLYAELANAIQARKHWSPDNNAERFAEWNERIKQFEDMLPHGSGFDSGTKIDLDASHADRLVFHTSYHHMNDGGFYDGWTEHTVTVTPAFIGTFHIRISGPSRNDIKEVISQEFDVILETDVTYDILREQFPQFAITSKWEDKDGSPSQCYQAWYVGGVRYWNDFQSAKDVAARLMQEAFYSARS